MTRQRWTVVLAGHEIKRFATRAEARDYASRWQPEMAELKARLPGGLTNDGARPEDGIPRVVDLRDRRAVAKHIEG